VSTPIKTDEIRAAFLEFFGKRGHRVLPSDSLVPTNDPSLLFTGAGMNQFKDEFMGRGDPELRRATTSQKCIRVPDIENVGRTADHHTFFEMLGNFSFGDYFKKEAIDWAWEFCLDVLRLDQHQLHISVHDADDEAYALWKDRIGVPADNIHRYDDSENYWPADAPTKGPDGLCGPDSEIFFDTGTGCGKPECHPNCECRRFVEFWNLVFTQYNRVGVNQLEPLDSKNIDTGMGLERMARIMQGKTSNFDIDIFLPIIKEISSVIGVPYERDTESGVRMRRISDHVRSVIFCLSDGILFSNEGRGYVSRRLLRRAVRDGRELGMHDAFLHKIVPAVATVMGSQYPEIGERSGNLARYILTEEERFHQTLEQGLSLLEEHLDELERRGQKLLSGDQAFKLYDTYGFPLDLTQLILNERGIEVDTLGFDQCMERQREQARTARGVVSIFGTGPLAKIKEFARITDFVGYERTESDANILAIVHGKTLVDKAEVGDEVDVLLDKTSFYGESGGQVGDTGRLFTKNSEIEVHDTQSVEGYILHTGQVTQGSVSVGTPIKCSVDVERRNAIRRNHTVTHILHHVLRKVLGDHVEQSGSMVAPDRMRFDYSQPTAPTNGQLEEIENQVNDLILRNDTLSSKTTSLKDAKKVGAMALFTEKYGERVRMVSVGDYSHELCGGTHLDSTGKIGLFKIISDSSIAAGFRRIEGVTGKYALKEMRHRDDLLAQLCSVLQTDPERLVERTESILDENRELKKHLKQQKKKETTGAVEGLLSEAEDIAGVKVLTKQMPDGASAEELRMTIDALRNSEPLSVAVLASNKNGKCLLVCGATKEAVAKGISAGDIVKGISPSVGGGGGGRPDLAQAGGKNPDGIADAFAKAREIIRTILEA